MGYITNPEECGYIANTFDDVVDYILENREAYPDLNVQDADRFAQVFNQYSKDFVQRQGEGVAIVMTVAKESRSGNVQGFKFHFADDPTSTTTGKKIYEHLAQAAQSNPDFAGYENHYNPYGLTKALGIDAQQNSSQSLSASSNRVPSSRVPGSRRKETPLVDSSVTAAEGDLFSDLIASALGTSEPVASQSTTSQPAAAKPKETSSLLNSLGIDLDDLDSDDSGETEGGGDDGDFPDEPPASVTAQASVAVAPTPESVPATPEPKTAATAKKSRSTSKAKETKAAKSEPPPKTSALQEDTKTEKAAKGKRTKKQTETSTEASTAETSDQSAQNADQEVLRQQRQQQEAARIEAQRQKEEGREALESAQTLNAAVKSAIAQDPAVGGVTVGGTVVMATAAVTNITRLLGVLNQNNEDQRKADQAAAGLEALAERMAKLDARTKAAVEVKTDEKVDAITEGLNELADRSQSIEARIRAVQQAQPKPVEVEADPASAPEAVVEAPESPTVQAEAEVEADFAEPEEAVETVAETPEASPPAPEAVAASPAEPQPPANVVETVEAEEAETLLETKQQAVQSQFDLIDALSEQSNRCAEQLGIKLDPLPPLFDEQKDGIGGEKLNISQKLDRLLQYIDVLNQRMDVIEQRLSEVESELGIAASTVPVAQPAQADSAALLPHQTRLIEVVQASFPEAFEESDLSEFSLSPLGEAFEGMTATVDEGGIAIYQPSGALDDLCFSASQLGKEQQWVVGADTLSPNVVAAIATVQPVRAAQATNQTSPAVSTEALAEEVEAKKPGESAFVNSFFDEFLNGAESAATSKELPTQIPENLAISQNDPRYADTYKGLMELLQQEYPEQFQEPGQPEFSIDKLGKAFYGFTAEVDDEGTLFLYNGRGECCFEATQAAPDAEWVVKLDLLIQSPELEQERELVMAASPSPKPRNRQSSEAEL